MENNNEEFQGGYNPEDGMYYAKGSYDNEIEYNNEVICLVNHADEYFLGIGQAMQENRFTDADAMLDQFVEQNRNNIIALDELGSYEEDDSLLSAAKKYLQELTSLLNDSYKTTLGMVKNQSHSPQELAAQQEQFGTKLQDITSELSNGFQEFMEKYDQSTDDFDYEKGGYNPADGQYYPKGSFDNEAEYYNEIIHLVNYKDDYLSRVGQALQASNFSEAEELLHNFLTQNDEAKAGLKKLGDYEGDADLLDASIAYIDSLTQIIHSDYQPMVASYKAQNMAEFKEKQDALFQKLENTDNQLAEALEQFMEKYDEDNLSEQTYADNTDQYTGMERKEYDPNNPYLQPIHGIAIEDYAAASAKLANGMTEDQVAKALGVERPQWDEANQLWQQRMQQDTEMTVIGLFGEFFGTAESHPKFQNITDDASVETNAENLARIKVDPEYYLELTAGMQAAYNYGIDGAQWLRDNHGLSLGDFQGVAMQWSQSPVYIELISQLPDKTKAYEAKFAEEMGGNIADDIEF